MATKLRKDKQEQQVAREERKAFEAELAENAAHRPRPPMNRTRTITFIAFGIIAVLAGVFGWLVLLPASSQAPSGLIHVGVAAPTFRLPIYYGGNGSVDLAGLHGKPVVMNFWSESCGPCRAEMPYLQQVYAEYGTARGGHGEFALLGVNQADPKDDIATFGAEFKITYPLLFDKGSSVNIAYSVTAIPTTYFIDSNGIVRAVFATQLDSHTMQEGLAAIGILFRAPNS